MRPSISYASDTSNKPSSLVLSQTWQKGGSCPKGTIPIRRIQRHDLLRATSLEHFGRDGPKTFTVENSTNDKSGYHYGTKAESFSLPDHSVIIRAYLEAITIFFFLHIIDIILHVKDWSSPMVGLHLFFFFFLIRRITPFILTCYSDIIYNYLIHKCSIDNFKIEKHTQI
jgi:hypothetical protein